MLLVSDIHFGRNRPEDVDAFLRAAENPELSGGLVIIAGDLTQNGSESEYRDAAAFIRRIKEAGNVVVATPGNHDFGARPIPLVPVAIFERLLLDEGRERYRRYILPLLTDQSAIVAHEGFDIVVRHRQHIIVALRSTHRGTRKSAGLMGVGRVREQQLRWAGSVLANISRSADDRVHLLTHRALWKGGGDKHRPMREAERLVRELLAPFEFDSFIHGHNHRPTFEPAPLPGSSRLIFRVGLPTLSDRNGKHERGFAHWRPDGQLVVIPVQEEQHAE